MHLTNGETLSISSKVSLLEDEMTEAESKKLLASEEVHQTIPGYVGAASSTQPSLIFYIISIRHQFQKEPLYFYR